MGLSTEWDSLYRKNTHMAVWPWSDLVSLVRRNYRNITPDTKVLELGCGAGANIPFFASLGVKYYSVEGSPTIVCMLKDRFPQFAETIVSGDFTSNIPFEFEFDLVVDRASLTSNAEASIRRCLDLIFDRLAPGGLFIGVDWYSTNHSDYRIGRPGGDRWTREDIETGGFEGVGKVHFSDEDHLRSLFSRFEILGLEEKQQKSYIPPNDHVFSSWLVVARKPHR